MFLLTCPATLPFPFASHPWFVVNDKGTLSRWEVGGDPQGSETRWGALNKDLVQPTAGIVVLPFTSRFHWRSGTLLGYTSGDQESLAHRMALFIEDSPNTYPYTNFYKLLGPNSNTYAQWVLDQFPESGLSLPWNAFGKNHLHKKSQ